MAICRIIAVNIFINALVIRFSTSKILFKSSWVRLRSRNPRNIIIMDLVFQLHFRPNLRMDIVFDFVNLNVAKCLRQECELCCSHLKKWTKENSRPKKTIYLVLTRKIVVFLFNSRNVKLNWKLVNRGSHNNVYVLMQMEFLKTTKLFQCYFSLK